MTEQNELKLAKWPFLIGDLLLLGLATFIVYRGHAPLTVAEALVCAGVVALGAYLGVLPFILEYRMAARLAESGSLTTTVAKINQLEAVAGQISGATAQWQNVQEASDRTTTAAKEIAQRMTEELKWFTEFMKKAAESEKATLRLEAEKLRRAEKEYVQVIVRVLDHIFALQQGALRSGQPKLIENLGQFQNACRDAARRIGLLPFVVAANEPFDAARHQLTDSQTPPSDGRVSETIAAGYTFQGQLLRPALVTLQSDAPGETPEAKSFVAAEKSAKTGAARLEEQSLL